MPEPLELLSSALAIQSMKGERALQLGQQYLGQRGIVAVAFKLLDDFPLPADQPLRLRHMALCLREMLLDRGPFHGEGAAFLVPNAASLISYGACAPEGTFAARWHCNCW